MSDLLEKAMDRSSSVKKFLKKLDDGKAEQSDVSLYAADLGECVADIINSRIHDDMSWDELNDLVMPLFKEVHEMVCDAADNVQKKEDGKDGIGIKPVRPEFPERKIHDLIYKIYEELKEQEDDKQH